MKPLYWILIIIGVVATGVVTTLIITKRNKNEDKNEDVEENTRLAYNSDGYLELGATSTNCYGCDGRVVDGICLGNITKVPCKKQDTGDYTF